MVKNEVTKVLMTVQVQSPTQLDQAAEDMEQRAERIANITYSAPTETGEVPTTVDGRALRAPQGAGAGAARPDMPGMRVARNDPCPCGSGKKYKQCHGKLA